MFVSGFHKFKKFTQVSLDGRDTYALFTGVIMDDSVPKSLPYHFGRRIKDVILEIPLLLMALCRLPLSSQEHLCGSPHRQASEI